MYFYSVSFNSCTVFLCILKILKDSLLLNMLVCSLFFFFLTVRSGLEANMDICDYL